MFRRHFHSHVPIGDGAGIRPLYPVTSFSPEYLVFTFVHIVEQGKLRTENGIGHDFYKILNKEKKITNT